MELKEQALHFCTHIENLTHIHCSLLDLNRAAFCVPPFRCSCELRNRSCDEIQTHLYGSYEAERWDGKYLYYCPRNLVFISTSLQKPGSPAQYAIITGPFIMTNRDNEVFEDDILRSEPMDNIPQLTTTQARSLNEMVHAVCGYLTNGPVTPDVDSGRHAAVLQMIYDMNENPDGERYPLENERKLQKSIIAGDLATSRKLLNELLCRFLYVCGPNMIGVKSHVRELLTLMSRAAVKGGADVNESFSFVYQCEKELDDYHDFESLNIWLSATLQRFIRFMSDFNDIKHKNVINKTTGYIEEHLAEKLTLDEAAEHVYLSKSYFCRILKEELGCTFTEHVNRLRVERSKELLRDTTRTISSIAASVGFDDQSYFTRIFKRSVGMSPKQYRELRT